MLARRAPRILLLSLMFGCGLSSAWSQEAAKKDAPAATSSRRPRPFSTSDTPRKLERLRTFDVRHIKAQVTLDPRAKDGAGEIRGTVTHTMAPLYAGLTTLTLDCGSELQVAKIAIRTRNQSRPLKFERQAEDKLAISLETPFAAGEVFDLEITYQGTPQQGLYLIQPDAVEPGRPVCFWTQGEPDETRHWLPCYDFPNDKATSEMVATVPKPLRVLSNGTLVETKENADGTVTDHWKMDTPHASYLISLVASEFTIAHDKYGELPVDYYVTRNHDEATARRALGKTPAMMAFFEKVTGQKYPYPKYAQAFVPDFTMGGMENISATTLNEFVLGDEISYLERDADGLVAHELAHQWFGDLVTCRDWPHLWLNEGFASYFDPLFAEHDRGEAAFRLRMESVLRGYLAGDNFQRRPIVEPRYRRTMELFDGVTYSKGACVLHSLRGLVGDDAWWKAIKHYVARHREQVVETDDLRRAFEEITGRDLGWFFEQWVFKAGHPELKARWRYEKEDQTLRLTVEQVQNLNEQTPLFRLPTIVEIDDGSSTTTTKIVIDGKLHEFVIPVKNEPRMVQIDPKGWLIKELDFDKPVSEWAYQLEHARDVLGRMDAARALAKAKDDPAAIAASGAGLVLREKDPSPRLAMVNLIASASRSTAPPRSGRPAMRTPAFGCRRSRALAAQDRPRARVACSSAWNEKKRTLRFSKRSPWRTLARWKAGGSSSSSRRHETPPGRDTIARTDARSPARGHGPQGTRGRPGL
ncbi:MAG: M1 family metallopeptidase [Isosphaeraceae bacterium]